MKSFLQYISEEVEAWKDQKAKDDDGNEFSVGDLYKYIKNNEIKAESIAIKDTDGVKWWKKQYSMKNPEHVKRLEKADTSYPVIAVRMKNGKYTIPDGLNRIMKLHNDGETMVSAYVLSQKQFDLAKKSNKD